jgi:hypothetical protein
MDEADWAITEFGAAMLGDSRRTDRLIALATVLGQRPAASIPAACDDPAMRKGAYRFFENAAITPAAILASHVDATWERVAAVPVVLAVQDTTELDFTGHPATSGLGPLRHGRERGWLAHSTLALTPDGLPLGLLAQEVWARPEVPPAARGRPKPQRPREARESRKWLTSLAAVADGCANAPETTIISVGDREADVYDLFVAPRPANVELLVRAQHDRWVRVATDEHAHIHWLRDVLATAPVACTRQVAMAREVGHPARTATVTVRWLPLTLRPPDPRRHELPPVAVWAIWVHEDDPPVQTEALDWILLTTVPVTTTAEALERVDWYTCRWVIEVWHKVLKSGCLIERRQLASAANLQRGLALFSVIAWRLLYAMLLARAVPTMPCTVLLEGSEWQALCCAIHPSPHPPVQPPCLGQAVHWLAQLGGYMGRNRDDPPGAEVLWRGLHRLVDLTLMYHVFTRAPTRARCG